MTMRKRLLSLLIIAPLLIVALHAAGQQATKAQSPAAKAGAAAPAATAAPGPLLEQYLVKFPLLNFLPPQSADFRSALSNGLVVYIAEDHGILLSSAM